MKEYFLDLKFGFGVEDKNLQKFADLLDNFAENSALKLRITNEMKKLEAKNHIILNKE